VRPEPGAAGERRGTCWRYVRVFQWGIWIWGVRLGVVGGLDWAAVWINESGSRWVETSMSRSARRVTGNAMRK
jgi:hypothetical protein